MSPAAKQEPRGWFGRLRAPQTWLRPESLRGRAILAIAVVAAVFFGSRLLWRMVREHVETRPEYQAAVDNIQITPLPAWIHTDVKTEVIRDAGLPAELSILDDRLIDRLKQAFALHPWIARVDKVERSYPNHIQVEVVYRRPVAMVEVRGGLLPIDAEAVLLPTADFSPAEAENYLRISGASSSPLGPLGTAWADPAVAASAKLAALLQPVWSQLQLRRIRIRNLIAPSGAQMMYLELATRSGTTFVWGPAPDTEAPQEPTAAEKLSRLKQLAGKQGSLDATPADERDLRRRAAPVAEVPKAEAKQ